MIDFRVAGAEARPPMYETSLAVVVFMSPIKARATWTHNYRAMGVDSGIIYRP